MASASTTSGHGKQRFLVCFTAFMALESAFVTTKVARLKDLTLPKRHGHELVRVGFDHRLNLGHTPNQRLLVLKRASTPEAWEIGA